MDQPDFISQQTSESKRFYLHLNPPANHPFVVVCGGVERTDDNYVINRDSFPYFAIELVTDGVGQVTLPQGTFKLSRGSAFAYGPEVPHRIENIGTGGMKKYFLDISGADAAHLLREGDLLNGRAFQVGHVGELVQLWDAIDREARDSSALSNEICELLCRALILKVRQRQSEAEHRISKSSQTYRTVREFIAENYMQVRTIEEVADACGLSPIYISRLFKRYHSGGAYRFLMRLRMNHAADLLLHHDLTVAEVAMLMGFADQFQFTRAFKREYGLPPNGLVRRRSAGESNSTPQSETNSSLNA